MIQAEKTIRVQSSAGSKGKGQGDKKAGEEGT